MKSFYRKFSSLKPLWNASPKIKSTNALLKPQYDFKALRAAPEIYQDSIDRRKVKLPDNSNVQDILLLYNKLLDARNHRDGLVSERKVLQQKLKSKVSQQSDIDLHQNLTQLKTIIKDHEMDIELLENSVFPLIESVPNLISPDSLINEQQLIGMIHEDKKVPADSVRTHREIGIKLGILDFDSASRVSGTSSYFLINDGALLEQALIQYALSKSRQKGWALITPPSLIRQEFTNACGFKPRDQNNEQQVYMINNDGTNNLCLTGTAEIPIAGWGAHKTLPIDEKNHPVIRKVGVSRSYRAEAGARGSDTKGLYRVHEFSKVELFAWTESSNIQTSINVHDEILELQKEILTELGLCCRILNMPPDDLGAPAYKKYDIEAWMPGRGSWGEVTSTSNCLDYQSRRLHTKYPAPDGSLRFAMTLNGTAMAIPRVMIAIIENNYDPKNNRIEIPFVLRKWMDDKEYIEFQNPS